MTSVLETQYTFQQWGGTNFWLATYFSFGIRVFWPGMRMGYLRLWTERSDGRMYLINSSVYNGQKMPIRNYFKRIHQWQLSFIIFKIQYSLRHISVYLAIFGQYTIYRKCLGGGSVWFSNIKFYKKEIRSHFHLKEDNIKIYDIVTYFEILYISDVSNFYVFTG